MSSETNLAIVMSESILITWQHYSKESQLFGMRRIRIGTELNLIKRHKRYFLDIIMFRDIMGKIICTDSYHHRMNIQIIVIRWEISILHDIYCI